jgi:hypothetical protein
MESCGVQIHELLSIARQVAPNRLDALTRHSAITLGRGAILHDPTHLANINRVRRAFVHGFGTQCSALLELESDRLEKLLPEESGTHPTKETAKKYVALICLIAQAALRACLVACDPLTAEYATLDLGVDANDYSTIFYPEQTIAASTRLSQNITTMCYIIHRVSKLSSTDFANLTIPQIATLMWSYSHPYGHKVFLSFNGPELGDRVLQALSKLPNALNSPTECNFFIESMLPPLVETKSSWVAHNVWESTQFHAFATSHYFSSKNCKNEMELWILLQKIHSWRQVSHSWLVDPESQRVSEDGRRYDELGPRCDELESVISRNGIFLTTTLPQPSQTKVRGFILVFKHPT